MDEFPSNSQRPPAKEVSAEKEKPKLEPVTTGKVTIRKKPLGRRFLDTFLQGNPGGAAQYVLMDVIVPAVRDVVTDAISQGLEKLIYGDARSSSRRTGQRPGGGVGHISYNRYATSTPAWKKDREDPRPTLSRQARAAHNFDEIVLETRVEVLAVLDAMAEQITKYGQVSVGTMYDLCNYTASFTDEKWGWSDLSDAQPRRVTGGYLLDMPKPEQLD